MFAMAVSGESMAYRSDVPRPGRYRTPLSLAEDPRPQYNRTQDWGSMIFGARAAEDGTSMDLIADQSYENVYLIFADASGYSNIVISNPRDRASQAFDFLENRVVDRVRTVKASHRCSYARVWHWYGDGGL